jgi:hypothetical protein
MIEGQTMKITIKVVFYGCSVALFVNARIFIGISIKQSLAHAQRLKNNTSGINWYSLRCTLFNQIG